MPEINGKQWTKEEVHAALKDGRVEEVWPGATFTDHGDYGDLQFADGSCAGIRFDAPPEPNPATNIDAVPEPKPTTRKKGARK